MALTRMSGCCAWNRGLPLARAYLDTVLIAYTRLFPWCTCAHTHSRAQNALEILKYLLTCLNNVSKRSSR